MRERRPEEAPRTALGRLPTEDDLPGDAVRRVRLLLAQREADEPVTPDEIRAEVLKAGGRLPRGPAAIAFALSMAKVRSHND